MKRKFKHSALTVAVFTALTAAHSAALAADCTSQSNNKNEYKCTPNVQVDSSTPNGLTFEQSTNVDLSNGKIHVADKGDAHKHEDGNPKGLVGVRVTDGADVGFDNTEITVVAAQDDVWTPAAGILLDTAQRFPSDDQPASSTVHLTGVKGKISNGGTEGGEGAIVASIDWNGSGSNTINIFGGEYESSGMNGAVLMYGSGELNVNHAATGKALSAQQKDYIKNNRTKFVVTGGTKNQAGQEGATAIDLDALEARSSGHGLSANIAFSDFHVTGDTSSAFYLESNHSIQTKLKLENSTITLNSGWDDAPLGAFGIATRNGGEVSIKDSTITLNDKNTTAFFSEFEADDNGDWQPTTTNITLSGTTQIKNTSDNAGKLLIVVREEGVTDANVVLNLQDEARAWGDIDELVIDEAVKDNEDVVLADLERSSKGGTVTVNLKDNAKWYGVNLARTTVADTDQDSAVVVEADKGYAARNINFNSTVDIVPGATLSAQGAVRFNGQVTATDGTVVAQDGSTVDFTHGFDIGEFAANNATVNFGGLSADERERKIAKLVLDGQNTNTKGGNHEQLIDIINAHISNHAQLGGNLRIRNLNLQGGILNPGNSIGVIEVASVEALEGVYIAEIDKEGNADLLRIAGTADLSKLGLQLEQLDKKASDNYKLDHDYKVIEAQSFGDTKLASAELGVSLKNLAVKLNPVKYEEVDGKDVVLVNLSYDASKAGGYLNDVYGALPASLQENLALTDTEVLKDLTGEVHGNTTAALQTNAATIQRSLQNRVRMNTRAGKVPGAPIAQSSSDMPLPKSALPQSADHPLWAEVVGNWSQLKATEYASKTKSNFGGVFIGGDAEVGAGWRLGGSVGYGQSKVKTNERASKSDVDSTTFALYAGNSHELANGNHLNLTLGTAYTHHSIKSKRSVRLAQPVQLKGKYKAHDYQLFGDIGYEFAVGQSSSLEPFASVAWQQIRNKAFTESGDKDLALRVGKSHTSTTTFGLGLRGSSAFNLGDKQARVMGSLAWQHLNGDRTPSSTMSFLGNPTATFTSYGNQLSANALATRLGFEAELSRNATFGLGYDGNFGSKHRDHTGSAYVKVSF